MHPLLFGTVPAYGVFLALAIVAGVATSLVCARRCGVTAQSRTALISVLVMVGLIGLVGAKLDSVLERGRLQSLRWEIENGYRYPGAIALLAVAIPLLISRRRIGISPRTFVDIAAPAAGVAMAVTRLGCFMSGCCHGPPSNLPWAVSFPSGTPAWFAQLRAGAIRPDAVAALPVHPLQLYFGATSLTIGLVLLWWAPRRAYAGQVLLGYLVLDNLSKAVLEPLRDPPAPHLYWLSLAVGLSALTMLAASWVVPRRLAAPAAGRIAPSLGPQ